MDWFAIAFGADYNALSEIVAAAKQKRGRRREKVNIKSEDNNNIIKKPQRFNELTRDIFIFI